MERELVCITCPMGCRLTVSGTVDAAAPGEALVVTGNRCPRGAVYAREELLNPHRTVTATCAGVDASGRRVRIPVRTDAPYPRERIGGAPYRRVEGGCRD